MSELGKWWVEVVKHAISIENARYKVDFHSHTDRDSEENDPHQLHQPQSGASYCNIWILLGCAISIETTVATTDSFLDPGSSIS